MINYSRYCESCKEFFPTFRTAFKTRVDDFRGDRVWLCPKCAEPLGAITCYWMLTVSHDHDKDFVRRRCTGLDKLKEICYNCDNRFKCWTESL